MADVKTIYSLADYNQSKHYPCLGVYTWKYTDVQKSNYLISLLKQLTLNNVCFITFFDYSFESQFSVPGNTIFVVSAWHSESNYKYCAITTKSTKAEIKSCVDSMAKEVVSKASVGRFVGFSR